MLENAKGYRKVLALAVLGNAFLAVTSCQESSSPSYEDDAGPLPDAGPDHDVGDTQLGDAVSEDGSACAPTCSSDLHRVLDCHGNELKVCPPDEGCEAGTGACVSACDAARSNKSTIGCEYYSVQPEGSTNAGGCFAVFIANTWTSPVTISVDFGGTTPDLDAFARVPSGSGLSLTYAPLSDGRLAPGQVAILFVSGEACPPGVVPPHSGPNVVGTAIGEAFHITTDRPVVAYDIYPYGGGDSVITSATLLLPTSSWGTNYVAIDPFEKSALVALPMAIQLVAQEDGTNVAIVPTNDILAGTSLPGRTKGTLATYSLHRGQVLELTTMDGLNGSVIQSTKPVGMWSSIACFNVDVATRFCDSAHQQIPPVSALGSEYVGVRYRNRLETEPEETPPWRIMGLVNGTTLTWEPEPPPGAPNTLNAGEVVRFDAAGPFVVRSQDERHPIYVGAHMTGCHPFLAGPGGCMGDPEWVNVVPAEQFLSSYVFFTDPTYPETNIVVVRVNTGNGFQDVTLDCAGPLGDWKPIDAAGRYQYTRVDLVRGNFEPQGACDNGIHEIRSDAPFGITVWGWGSSATGEFYSEAVSYAYPGGQGVRPINTVVIPPVPK